MSIIGFHRVLITVAILFCALFAAWEFRVFSANGGLGPLALAVAFTFAAAALCYYLANLGRFLHQEP